MYKKLIIVAFAISLILIFNPSTLPAQTTPIDEISRVAIVGDTGVERISLRTDGTEAEDDSYAPAISADGRYIAFESDADNLVPNDNNGARDIFIHDRDTNKTTRMSVSTDEEEGNFDSFAPVVSDDGRYVAFHSYATNLVEDDNNNVPDVFIRDRDLDETYLVSVGTDGNPGNDASYDPDISGSGRFIVFWSYADNLIDNDTNDKADVFRYDLQFGNTDLVSKTQDGEQTNGHSRYPRMTAASSRVVYESEATNLATGDSGTYVDIFTYTFNSGNVSRVSNGRNDQEANGDSFAPFFARDGTYVVFTSFASNLVEDDDNDYTDIFFVRGSGTEMELISVATDGDQTNAPNQYPSISADSRYVVFRSKATNLVDDNLPAERNIYIRDRDEDTTTLVNLNNDNSPANDESWEPIIAADGRYVVFRSGGNNLVDGDSNGEDDIFVRDLEYSPPPPPPPDPTFVVNYVRGAPGSTFAFTGANLTPNQSAVAILNQRLLGSPFSTDNNGGINIRLQTESTTEEGIYILDIISGQTQLRAGFILDDVHPLRPDDGSGTIYPVPNGLAYDNLNYLPIFGQTNNSLTVLRPPQNNNDLTPISPYP